MDIQKAFYSVDQLLFNNCIKKISVGETFKWIQILLRNKESFIINGGTITKYFKPEKGARQRDPISAYLFILVLNPVKPGGDHFLPAANLNLNYF